MGSRYWLRLIEKEMVFRATRNDPQARLFRAALRGLSTGHAQLPVSDICRGVGNETRRANQVRYTLYKRLVLVTGKDSLWGPAMPTLLVAITPGAPGASERRCKNEPKNTSRLYPISSRDQDAVRPFAGPQCQDGVRCYHRSAPGMFRSKVRPSPVGEDRRQCRSIPRTLDRCHNKCLGPYRSLQTLIRQTIFSFSSDRP